MTTFNNGNIVRYHGFNDAQEVSDYTGVVIRPAVDEINADFSVRWDLPSGPHIMHYGGNYCAIDTLVHESINYKVNDTVVYVNAHNGVPEFEGHKATVLGIDSNGNTTHVRWLSAPYGEPGVGYWDARNFRKVEQKKAAVTLPQVEQAFKIGDRVRVVRTYEYGCEPLSDGKVGILSGFNNNNSSNLPYRVDLTNSYSGWNVYEIELVTDDNDNKDGDDVTTTAEAVTGITNEEIDGFKAEVYRLKTLVEAAQVHANSVESKYETFREQVAEYVIEKRKEEEICQDGYEDFMSEMGLEEFIKKPFEAIVTLRIPAEALNDIDRDSLDARKIADILYAMNTDDLAWAITEVDVEDADE